MNLDDIPSAVWFEREKTIRMIRYLDSDANMEAAILAADAVAADFCRAQGEAALCREGKHALVQPLGAYCGRPGCTYVDNYAPVKPSAEEIRAALRFGPREARRFSQDAEYRARIVVQDAVIRDYAERNGVEL